jgi:membrane-bound lytic murein transglycosylase D
LRREKRGIDERIGQLEAELEKASGASAERLLEQLDAYESQAQSLRGSLLYTLARRSGEDFVTRELRAVMAELGAEVYSIPPEFVARVKYYIEQNQGPERPVIARALGESGPAIRRIRRILEEERLPPDLAYIPVVESAVSAGPASEAGAVGPWQFTAPTARAFGLRVDGEVDERKDLVKSTRASCRYLRELILDFGAGTSVLLALAAYNSGPAKVKQAVSRTVKDPIKQRNFWYLYRARALPPETREFVPKVFGVILIGRNPGEFGF